MDRLQQPTNEVKRRNTGRLPNHLQPSLADRQTRIVPSKR